MRFGSTTLADLRKRFGSNGFAFQDRGAVIDFEGGVVLLNSYEVGTSVVTFITKVTQKDYSRMKESGSGAPIADYAKLDAITVADNEYAKSEWGDRIYDPNYKKVNWK